ncbi:hypothetical protein MAR621_03004 [Maribacter dokdonensis]|nr:hypothetical protein MAR621_03004 [Maribacter dokdonensis]
MERNIRLLKQNLLWVLFIGFAFFAIWTREDEFIFTSQSPYSFGKYIVWVIFFCFFGYSIYSSSRENFFKSVSRISEMFWGWQIGIDLYIGLILPLLIIYLYGGVFVFLVWLIPVLIYANLATLLYLALNYDSFISNFII